jgi:predicted nuclease with TOPRIM domain
MSNETNTWGEYSKLVLKELETLARNIETLKEEIIELKNDFVRIDNRLSKVDDLYNWKKRVDDIVSPIQLNNLVDEVQDLKAFKIKAITIFFVIQFIMSVAVLLLRFIQ